MYIVRKPLEYSEAELREIYARPHEHYHWEDHVNRVQRTIEFARRNSLYGRVADLSCGDGSIAKALSSEATLGDFAPGYFLTGPIKQTIELIDFQDVFIMTETLEHLSDPLGTLWKIRPKTRKLLLSTPVHDDGALDDNPEHLWVYDRSGVEFLLDAADFVVLDYEEIYNGIGYRYGVWACQ